MNPKFLLIAAILLFTNSLVNGQNNNENPKWLGLIGQEGLAFKNQTMEIGFYLDLKIQEKINDFSNGKEDGLNPYDPEQVDFMAIFTSPSGLTKKQYGFYYQDYFEDTKNNKFVKKNTKYPWRLRFAPDEIGQWKMVATVTGNFDEKIQFEMTFTCENSDHKGPLTTSNLGNDGDRYLSYSQTGENFTSVAINLSNCGAFAYEPYDNIRHMKGIEDHASVGGNFTRFEIGAQNGLPDWQDMRNYNAKQDEMFGYDRLLQKAESEKMYYTIFRHHVELCGPDWGVSNWKNNPYKKAFNLQKQSEYFTNLELRKWQKNNLRYMYARWGYNPYWTFYGYSEIELFYRGIIEQEGISEKDAIKIFNEWFIDQKEYIKTELKPDEMFANSYGKLSKYELKNNFNGFFASSDVVAIHNYSTVKSANYEKRFELIEKLWKNYKKPIIIEEMGINDDKLAIYCCTKSEFHNSIWSTLFMGDFGTGMDWWWDRGVMDFDYHKDFLSIVKFLEGENIKDKEYTPQKWTDSKDYKRTLESFQLVSQDKERVLGWVHNATYYWRNIAVNDRCLQGLLDSSNLEKTCLVGGDTYLGRNESPRDFARKTHEDKYTSKGGFQPISNEVITDNPTFKIDNVLYNLGKRKYWYQIDFYSTNPDNSLKLLENSTQIVHANFFKDLVVHVPNLDINNPDVAFKVTYLGFGKNPSQTNSIKP